MAHVEKFKAEALGNMCGHYERKAERQRGYKRENIDNAKTIFNYNLAPERWDQVAFINRRIEALNLKRLRKDAVKMCDWVVTLPKDLPKSETEEFFKSVYRHLEMTYGRENVVSAWVHMDESQPHMHFAFVPVTKDGRLSAKKLLTREHLKGFHEALRASVERDLGHSVSITKDELQDAVDELKYSDMETFKKKSRAIELGDEYIEERVSAIRKLDSEIEKIDRKIEQLDSEKKELAKVVYEARSLAVSLEENNAVLKKDIENNLLKLEKIEKQYLEKKHSIDDLATQYDEKLQELNDINGKVLLGKKDISELSDRLELVRQGSGTVLDVGYDGKFYQAVQAEFSEFNNQKQSSKEFTVIDRLIDAINWLIQAVKFSIREATRTQAKREAQLLRIEDIHGDEALRRRSEELRRSIENRRELLRRTEIRTREENNRDGELLEEEAQLRFSKIGRRSERLNKRIDDLKREKERLREEISELEQQVNSKNDRSETFVKRVVPPIPNEQYRTRTRSDDDYIR